MDTDFSTCANRKVASRSTNSALLVPMRVSTSVTVSMLAQYGSHFPNLYRILMSGLTSIQGRFFAGTEIKLLLAHVLQNYDIKLKDGQDRPPNYLDEIWFIADQKAEVLFRSREM
jgi:hypothetical protein